MISELWDSSKSNSSNGRVDLTRSHLEGRSYLYNVYICTWEDFGVKSPALNKSLNTIIRDAKERLLQYNLVSLLRKPLAF